MADKLQPVRGTHDILPDDFEKFHAVVTCARELATLYGFREMATPIFEATEVFKRSMGDTSDVVSKEMFDFQTKGGESVCLRPEFTAGIARAFISNGMQQHLPLKLFSTGPLFRYERPQKGRQRQFHQVNFEWLGDGSVKADVEIILIAGYLLHSISGSKSCKLLINTLGDEESRAKYREALVGYLTPLSEKLSEDSKRRLVSNPLRILDSKSEQDKPIVQDAPRITDYLSHASKSRFDTLYKTLEQCKENGVFFQEIEQSSSLVRGLDYYTDTVFEFIGETGELGAQNTVLAGGRYDGLIAQMGGKPTPAIGFAAGIERLGLLGEVPLSKRIHLIVIAENIVDNMIYKISEGLRSQLHTIMIERRINFPISVEVLWEGDLKKRMERANKKNATHVLIANEQTLALKDMANGEQVTISLNDISDTEKLAALLKLN